MKNQWWFFRRVGLYRSADGGKALIKVPDGLGRAMP